MKLILLVPLLSCLVGVVWTECTDTKPDPACRGEVESVFGSRDPGMDGSLTCKGSEVYKNARGTGYFPSWYGPEGGCVDMRGAPLRTLQDYLEGKVNYVSVAMDQKISGFRYGVEVCIPEMNQAYKKRIRFKVVDHGPSFDGQGTARIDICTRTDKDACSGNINRKLTLYFQ